MQGAVKTGSGWLPSRPLVVGEVCRGESLLPAALCALFLSSSASPLCVLTGCGYGATPSWGLNYRDSEMAALWARVYSGSAGALPA